MRKIHPAPSGGFVPLAKVPTSAGDSNHIAAGNTTGERWGLNCLLSPWQQVLNQCIKSANKRGANFLHASVLFSNRLTFCHVILKQFTHFGNIPSKSWVAIITFVPLHLISSFLLTPSSSSKSIHLLSSAFLFPSLPPHPFQYSTESIVSGLVVCPLKRSGRITPVIPL